LWYIAHFAGGVANKSIARESAFHGTQL
jgi:hypothetical protein